METQDTTDSYDAYYESGTYATRYPAPNLRSLDFLEQRTAPKDQVLDIGAGEGRYAIPLAKQGRSVVAVEPSKKALSSLVKNARFSGVEQLVAAHSSLDEVGAPTLHKTALAALMFGVLGHINFEGRQKLLNELSCGLRKNTWVIGSVPSRLRRFRKEQKHLVIPDGGSAPRFEYARPILEGSTLEVALQYTAFTPSELTEELEASGLRVCEILPESVLPETAVTNSARIAAVDRSLCRALPITSLAYGLLYIARV